MLPKDNHQPNVDRFLGFQDEYDRYRPEAPGLITSLLTGYLGRRPELVADVGCGTGLSTLMWLKAGAADRIVGVDPNPDMLGLAQAKLQRLLENGAAADVLSFTQGYSNRLPFESGSVDIITCSQSFHWMEPHSTLQEVGRCLRPGGVFAAFDCDWPPVLSPAVEQQYHRLIAAGDELVQQHLPETEQAHKWDKSQHLEQIKASGQFSFAREIVFHNSEVCDAERYVRLLLNQGGMQTVRRLGLSGLDGEIAAFRAGVEAYFAGRSIEVLFSYRMRTGVK